MKKIAFVKLFIKSLLGYNRIAFLVPIYEPHFEYGKNLIESWKKTKLNKQSDIYFIFTNDEERIKFNHKGYSIVLPNNLYSSKSKNIINIKKLYGLFQLKDRYEFIITLDAESLFIKNINLPQVCKKYFHHKILYGNKLLLINPELRKMIDTVQQSCKRYFYKEYLENIDDNLYLWFNQPCIYKTSTLDDFFSTINYKENKEKFTWYDFDYYIYMYYLYIYKNFKIQDIEIESTEGALESNKREIQIKSNKYKEINIYACSKSMMSFLDNPKLFFIFHLDRFKE